MSELSEEKQSANNAKTKTPENLYEIFPYLYLSSFPATKQYKELKVMKLTNIINVTNNIRPTEQQYKLFDVLYLPLLDDESYDILTAIKTLAFYIHSLVTNNENKKILVHCSAGISRSVSVILGYCMIYKKMKLLDAYNYVKNKKSNIGPNPGFMKQLINLEKKVFNVNEPSLKHRDYVIVLLKQIFPSKTNQLIGEILNKCNGDYVEAQNALFSL
eukprot:360089_1